MMAKNVFNFSVLASAAIGFGNLPGSAAAVPSICDATPGNLIINCGFETKNLRDWTQSGNVSFTFVSSVITDGPEGDPNSGNSFAFLGPLGSDGFLSQSFADTAGQTLQIEFFLVNDGNTPNDFRASFNGNALLSLDNDGAHGYTDYVFTATASGLDTLTIGGFRNDNGFFGLDDVSVRVIFEPASLALLGIALVGFASLRSGRLSRRLGNKGSLVNPCRLRGPKRPDNQGFY